MAGGASGAATIVNPVVSQIALAPSAPSGSVAATVSFDPVSLGPGRLYLNASVGCPWGVPAYDCVDSGWRLQTADGQWRNATATLTADARGVILTSVGVAPWPQAVLAASLGWGSWPILPLARVDSGAVALPFLRPVVSSNFPTA